MTWGDIQIIVLQKMFLNDEVLDIEDLDTYKEDDRYDLYLSNMPAACNEALNILNNVSNPIVGSYTITQEEPESPYVPTTNYELKTLCPGYKNIINVVYSYYDSTTGEYISDHNTTDYKVWNNGTLQLKTEYVGTWTVYYSKYPTRITSTTSDTFLMEMDDDVNTLLPLYIASQVFKEDNNTLSVTYRNEFEDAVYKLSQRINDNEMEFEDNSGWL